jgi:hypothetical protein
MQRFVLLISAACLALVSCDCMQDVRSVVVDKQTRKPLSNVVVSKSEKENPQDPLARKEYTDDSGRFHFTSISGGLGGCPDLVLYFTKPGYKTSKMRFPSFSRNDTVLLERIPGDPDKSNKPGN